MAKKTGPKGPSKTMDDAVFQQFVNMIRINCTQDEICSILDMSEQTLNARVKERGYANYRDCYKKHRAEGKTSLRRMIWKKAESGSFQAQKLLAAQELGFSDKPEATASVEMLHFDGWEIRRAKPDPA